MIQAFIIVLREGVEACLIVAITFAYLRKTLQTPLLQAVVWGIVASILASGLLGVVLWRQEGANEPLWEGVFGVVTFVLVITLIIHMWRVGPRLKQDMEKQLAKVTAPSNTNSAWGVFLFTLIMVTREGMETALLLLQIRDPQLISGIVLGVVGAAFVAWLWQQFSYQIKLKHFFQVTAVFLSLFALQILLHSVHEFSEMGILPFSDAIDKATDSLSLYGYYGKKFSLFTMIGCGLWLMGTWFMEKFSENKPSIAKAG